MVDEIITGLAKTSWLFVVARNSSFIYKGRVVDVKQVGRDLGVRYVLEGSVRKAGGRVRITGLLVDTATGAYLWADRFDGSLEDVFDLQDKVAATVVGAIEPALRDAEIQQARCKPTFSLDAYDWFLWALSRFNLPYASRYREGLELCRKATAIDPDYAAACALAAWGCAGICATLSAARLSLTWPRSTAVPVLGSQRLRCGETKRRLTTQPTMADFPPRADMVLTH
jgi:adenylate cyclase